MSQKTFYIKLKCRQTVKTKETGLDRKRKQTKLNHLNSRVGTTWWWWNCERDDSDALFRKRDESWFRPWFRPSGSQKHIYISVRITDHNICIVFFSVFWLYSAGHLFAACFGAEAQQPASQSATAAKLSGLLASAVAGTACGVDPRRKRGAEVPRGDTIMPSHSERR